MVLHRRTLLKRTGATAGLVALGTGAFPAQRAAVAQDVKLDLWDTFNADPRKQIVDDLAAGFAEENSVEVEHRGWTLEELQDTIPRVVESNQGPDVAQVNNGESLMGPMVRAGQLVDITDTVGRKVAALRAHASQTTHMTDLDASVQGGDLALDQRVVVAESRVPRHGEALRPEGAA